MTTTCPKSHFTPVETAKLLLKDITFTEDDHTLEPCKADHAWWDIIPAGTKDWAEIDQGRDLFTYEFPRRFSKCIANPPYRTNHIEACDRKNIFIPFVFRCLELCDGECWVLLNAKMWSSITPVRLKKIKDMGFGVSFLRVLSIKEWYGRYYWVCFKKGKTASSLIHF